MTTAQVPTPGVSTAGGNLTPVSDTPVRVVDVHAHVIVPEVQAAVHGHPGLAELHASEARRQGAPSSAVSKKMFGSRMPQLTDVDRRLADMDAAEVDVQVLSPSPSQYHYFAEPELALTVCRCAAGGVAAVVAEEPERFTGLGLVPLQHPGLCVQALDHALGLGLVGVEISSHAQRADGRTVELSDPALDPFWARAAATGAIVFLHPMGCTLEERLDRFYLSNTVGQPVENAVALSHLVFSGVLDRHPDLRVVAAHGGGYLPTFLGRSDHAWEVRPEARECADRPSSYLRRLWFDSLVHSPEALRALVAVVGADRVLLGSDFPFDMGVTDPVDRVRAAGLSATDTDLVLGGNAASLHLVPHHHGSPVMTLTEQTLQPERHLITHLRHVDVAVPDHDTQVAFYTEQWGLKEIGSDGNVTYLAPEGSPEQYQVRVRQNTDKRLDLIAFGAANAADVDELAARLGRDGVQLVTEPGALQTPGGGYGFRFFDVDGRTVEVSADVAVRQHRKIEEGESVPVKLSHVVLNTPDPETTVAFYDRHLSFKVSDTIMHPKMGKNLMWFLRCNPQHHSLAIARGPHTSLHHASFEMRGIDEYMRGTGRLLRAGVTKIWGPGRHKAGNNTFSYFLDPSGNTMEYTTELELLDEDTWHPHLYDMTDPMVSDQWGTANKPDELLGKASFNDPDKGAFVAPPV